MKICIDCGKELEQNTEKCDCIDCVENKPLPEDVVVLFKRSAGSRLLLAAMVFFTVAVIFNLFIDWTYWYDMSYNFDTSEYCLYNFTNLFSRFGICDGKNILLVMSACISFGTGYIGAVPSIILVIGLWLVYNSVNGENGLISKPKGIGMVESMLILFAGFSFWGVLVCLMISGIFFASLHVFGWEEALAAAYILLSPFCQIAVGMLYINMYRLANNLSSVRERRTIRTIRPIWSKLTVVFAVFSIILTIISAIFLTIYSPTIIVTNLISAAGTFLFGIFLISFTKRLDDFAKNKAGY